MSDYDASMAKEDVRHAAAEGDEYDHSRAKEDRRNTYPRSKCQKCGDESDSPPYLMCGRMDEDEDENLVGEPCDGKLYPPSELF